MIHGKAPEKQRKSISSEKTKILVETTVKFDNLFIGYISIYIDNLFIKGLQFHFKAGEGILIEPRK